MKQAVENVNAPALDAHDRLTAKLEHIEAISYLLRNEGDGAELDRAQTGALYAINILAAECRELADESWRLSLGYAGPRE